MAEKTTSQPTRKSVAKKIASDDGNTVTFAFADGTKRTAHVTDFPETIQRRFAQHGMSQKLGDKYNKAGSITEALEEFDAVVAQLVAGDWKSAGDSAGPKAGKTVRALYQVALANEKWAKKFMEDRKSVV